VSLMPSTLVAASVRRIPAGRGASPSREGEI
jgi:hypothetical protein